MSAVIATNPELTTPQPLAKKPRLASDVSSSEALIKPIIGSADFKTSCTKNQCQLNYYAAKKAVQDYKRSVYQALEERVQELRANWEIATTAGDKNKILQSLRAYYMTIQEQDDLSASPIFGAALNQTGTNATTFPSLDDLLRAFADRINKSEF